MEFTNIFEYIKNDNILYGLYFQSSDNKTYGLYLYLRQIISGFIGYLILLSLGYIFKNLIPKNLKWLFNPHPAIILVVYLIDILINNYTEYTSK